MTSEGTVLTAAQVLSLRMSSLLLAGATGPDPTSNADPAPVRGVAGIVSWFGAMQAQDLSSGVWSLGVRLPGYRLADVEAALEKGETLRTWPMRGTVHLVPPRDAAWMVELMGARVLPTLARRRDQLGISEAVAREGVDVLGQALAGGARLTRDQALKVLRDKGIDTDGQRGYHLLGYAAHLGVICFGPNAGTQQTFVLLIEWAPDPRRPSRDEALAIMAERYFRSHGPTTVKDFAGWTGLTLADCRRGIAAAGERITTARFGDLDVHLAPGLLDEVPADARRSAAGFRALPGFDEYLLGYKDRSLMLADEHKQAVVPGGNGVFQATLVRAGQVIATWRRTLTARAVTVAIAPLIAVGARDRAAVERALEPYGYFLDRAVEVRWPR